MHSHQSLIPAGAGTPTYESWCRPLRNSAITVLRSALVVKSARSSLVARCPFVASPNEATTASARASSKPAGPVNRNRLLAAATGFPALTS